MQHESPVNDIPAVVLSIALFMGGVEILMVLAGSGIVGDMNSIGWRSYMIEDFGYFPGVFEAVFERQIWTLDLMWRFVTYPFIHSSPTHALFAIALFLALGKFVGDQWHWAALLTIFFGSAITAAVVFGALAPQNWPLVGAYPVVYGLIGPFTYMLWVRLDATGGNPFRAFGLIGVIVLVQILWGLMLKASALFGMGGDASPTILYIGIADFSGFLFGLAVSPIVGPGGWKAFLARVRRR